MAKENGNNGESRLDHIERVLAQLTDDHIKFDDEHRRLLTAQVLLTDTVQKLAVTVDRHAAEAADSRKDLDDRMGTLVRMMDDLIRNRPPQPPA